MSRSQVEGGRRANAGPTDPGLVIETERQRLEDAFWEIYNKNVIDRKVLCDHIYGILLALMQNPVLMESPGDRFSVDQEGRVCFTINLSPNKPNPTLVLFPVETNVEFEKRLQLPEQELRTNSENLEIQRQQLMAELNDYNLAEKEILPDVRNLRNGSLVKRLLLRAFNDSYTYLRRSLEELQKLRENQGQVVEKAKLAKEIGDWLLKQIEQGNST
jgi:hypothetical protein